MRQNDADQSNNKAYDWLGYLVPKRLVVELSQSQKGEAMERSCKEVEVEFCDNDWKFHLIVTIA